MGDRRTERVDKNPRLRLTLSYPKPHDVNNRANDGRKQVTESTKYHDTTTKESR